MRYTFPRLGRRNHDGPQLVKILEVNRRGVDSQRGEGLAPGFGVDRVGQCVGECSDSAHGCTFRVWHRVCVPSGSL